MSATVKINENLFIGKQELQRIIDSLGVDGFKKYVKQDSLSFGFIKNEINFLNGRIQTGTNANSVKINALSAIDKNLNFLYRPAEDNIPIPPTGSWYWIQVQYVTSNIEVGTFSIDTAGNLVGVNSKITEILRGKPNHASIIKFVNSEFNTLEYEVSEVIDDSNAVLSGEFTNESDLQLMVVGTFEPISLSESHKNIFLYDYATLNINIETTLNTPPNPQEGIIFNLARVSVQSGQLVIQDKRTQLYESKSSYLINYIQSTTNKVFGVEAVKWDHPASTREFNQVDIAWAFRSSNWTTNSLLNIVSILAGQGGRFEDTSDFTDGDFDGWKLYTKNGKSAVIISSVKQSTQINLQIDVLDINNFVSGQEVIICPNTEEIEILVKSHPASNTQLPDARFCFPINQGKATLKLLAYLDTCLFNITFRYKNNEAYGDWYLPFGASRYLTESSFTDLGVQKPTIDLVYYNYTPVVNNGFIQLIRHPKAYINFTDLVDLNDKGGIYFVPDLELAVVSISDRRLDLTPSVTKQNVVIQGSSILTQAVRINLISTGAKNGTSFDIYFEEGIDNDEPDNLYSIKFYKDNTTVLFTMTQDQIWKGKQHFKAVFDIDYGSWYIYLIDQEYGTKENTYIAGYEVLDSSNTNHVENIGGKLVLVCSGFSQHILLNHNGASDLIHAVRFRNKKPVNNLHITVSDDSSQTGGAVFILGDKPADTANINYYEFNSGTTVPKLQTAVFNFIRVDQLIGSGSALNGYRLFYNTNQKTIQDKILYHVKNQIKEATLEKDDAGVFTEIGIEAIVTTNTFDILYETDVLVSQYYMTAVFEKVNKTEGVGNTGNIDDDDDNIIAGFSVKIDTYVFSSSTFYRLRVYSAARDIGVLVVTNQPYRLKVLMIRKPYDL